MPSFWLIFHWESPCCCINVILCLSNYVLWVFFFLIEPTKEMGRNDKKCLKIIFKIVFLLSCLICLTTTHIHPFSSISIVGIVAPNENLGINYCLKSLLKNNRKSDCLEAKQRMRNDSRLFSSSVTSLICCLGKMRVLLLLYNFFVCSHHYKAKCIIPFQNCLHYKKQKPIHTISFSI